MGFGDRFLSQPDLFPARLAGTPAGAEVLALEIPGGPYQVRGLSPAQRESLARHYGARASTPEPDGHPGTEVLVFAVDREEFLEFDRSGALNDFDFDYTENRVRIAGYGVMAQIRWSPQLGAALWASDAGEAGDRLFLEIFENFLRTLVAYKLLELGGAVLHSSAVVADGRAWLFFGPSGAGKTTIARRAVETGRHVLSDDINALYLEAGAARVAKMPFAGELGHTNERVPSLPVAALARLEQAGDVEWTPLSAASGMASLVSCCPFLNHDPHRMPALLSNLEGLLAQIPIGVLRTTRTTDLPTILELTST